MGVVSLWVVGWFCPDEMSNKMCVRARARGTLGNFEFSDFLIFKIFRFPDFQVCVRVRARAQACGHARARGTFGKK